MELMKDIDTSTGRQLTVLTVKLVDNGCAQEYQFEYYGHEPVRYTTTDDDKKDEIDIKKLIASAYDKVEWGQADHDLYATQKIFTTKGTLVDEVPYVKDDPNNGLPKWFFERPYIAIEIYPDENRAVWVSPMGPAPIWAASLDKFKTDKEMFDALEDWLFGADKSETSNPEKEPPECHENCDDPGCPYTH